MSRYTSEVMDRLRDYMRRYVVSFTSPNIDSRTKGQNFLNKYGKGTMVMNTVGLAKLFELNRSQQSLFLALLDDIKFSSDYVSGFCCKFVYSRFKGVRSNKTVFYKARDRFIELDLIKPIDGIPKWYILNERYIIKGKARNNEYDYNGNLIESNNYKGV